MYSAVTYNMLLKYHFQNLVLLSNTVVHSTFTKLLSHPLLQLIRLGPNPWIC